MYETADHVAFEILLSPWSQACRQDDFVSDFPEIVVHEYDRVWTGSRIARELVKNTCGRYVSLWDGESAVLDGCLNRLVDFLDDEPQAGIAIAKMRNEKGHIQPVARTNPALLSLLAGKTVLPGNPMVGWNEYRSGEADWVAGSGMIISRYLLDDIGSIRHELAGFWPVDFCLRARKAGWHIHYLHDAQITASLESWEQLMGGVRKSVLARICRAFLLKYYASLLKINLLRATRF